MRTLAERLVSDELWAIVRPLLPSRPRHPRGGRPRTVADRACMAGIVFMTVTSTPWRLLPARELDCGSPATCWRRFTKWAEAGVFDRLHLQLLDELGRRGLVDWSRVAIDTFSLRAKRGGPRWRKPGRSWQARFEAPPGRGRARASAGRCVDRGQRPRQSAVGGDARRPSLDSYPVWATAVPTGQGPRRQGLRPTPLPGLPASAWHHRPDRPSRDRAVGSAGPAAMAGGAVAVVAELLPTAAGVLGPQLGPVLCLCGGRLCAGVPPHAAAATQQQGTLPGRRATEPQARHHAGALR